MKCVSVFISLVIILLTNSAFAEIDVAPIPLPLQTEGICFSAEDAGRMVVDLENYVKQADIIKLLKEENAELQVKIDNLEKISKIQNDQLNTTNETIEQLNSLIDSQRKAYEEQIKQSKPSFLKQVGIFVGAILAGIGIGSLL